MENNLTTISNRKNSDKKNHESVNGVGNPLMYDPVFISKIRLSCPFCKNCGKKKIIKSLWALNCHFAKIHYNDAYCKKIISDLENLLRQGVIRQ